VTSLSLTALRRALSAWWSRSIGLLGIWIALSLTAVLRGGAMTLFLGAAAAGAARRLMALITC